MNTLQMTTTQSASTSALTMGSKRGRLLTRQPRVKKDTEMLSTADNFETEVISSGQQCWLTIPSSSSHHIIERHVSEPASHQHQSSSSSTQHLLHIPQTSYLTKQYSHPVLPSQSHSLSEQAQFKLIRQMSHPIQSMSTSSASASSSSAVTTFVTSASTIAQLMSSSMKTEPGEETHVVLTQQHGHAMSPAVVILPETVHVGSELPTIRVKSEELQRSISTPQTLSREPSLDSPRSSHCPVVRPGPALGCNFCWNTIDAHGRILRRKTKYHCPECQTNLCIVPCFQEYHERQTSDNPQPVNENKITSLKHYSKSGSL